MKRLHIYSRVSTKKQNVDNQTNQCLDYIQKHYENFNVFSYNDIGISRELTYKERPGLVKLIGSIQKNDIVIVSAVDRLGSIPSDIFKFVNCLRESNCHLTIACGLYAYSSVNLSQMEFEARLTQDVLGSLKEKLMMSLRVKSRSHKNSTYKRKGRGKNENYFFDKYRSDVCKLLSLEMPVRKIHSTLELKHCSSQDQSKFPSKNSLYNYIKRFNLTGAKTNE